RAKLAKHSIASEGASRQSAMIQLLRPMVSIREEDFDQGNLFNCDNGTLDLDRETFREHRREDFLTKVSPSAFDPQATCPTFEAVVNRAFRQNKDLSDFFQRLAGYFLSNLTVEQKIFMFYGSGANGKSTLL